jgi:hypothetical protein
MWRREGFPGKTVGIENYMREFQFMWNPEAWNQKSPV